MAKTCGVLLFVALILAILNTSASKGQLKTIRHKREWIVPPHRLRENVDYTKQEYIAKIRSDEETRTTIRYSLTGRGADLPPVNLFTVDDRTGLVRIHGVLDREEIPIYYLKGVAKIFPNGERAENDIDLRIVVEDENDNAPVFNLTTGAVYERSQTETFVVTSNATDADQAGNSNTKIAYKIVKQHPEDMFKIHRETGRIYVMKNTLDRERHDTYTLTVVGTDLDGNPNGNSGTGTAVIKILDVNDNIPTLETNHYECSVEENIRNVEVVRIQAVDADLIYTENWLAVFTIVSGNEADYFSIITDNKTNEGIVILNKELDYEELKEINLHVSVANKAAYHSSVVVTESKTYTIHIRVINQPEGPRFKPAVKVITISEEHSSITLNQIITNYAAIDSDTQLTATNVRYAKGRDYDNWLIIDEKTADIKFNKKPDYESKFLINGTYYAHIICITNEAPAKTATGTIAIQVKDFNDHCPVLIHQSQSLCYEDHVVYVTAVDKDQFPNAAPFGFQVNTTNTKESWSMEHLNETTAIFRSQKTLWPGMYHLFVDVWDQQGKICGGQALEINVCTCDAAKVCVPKKITSRFGGSGVLLMLLGLLLLLLVPLLLLLCICGGPAAIGNFKTMPFEAREHLIAYNTEGQGEDKDVAFLQMPTDLDNIKLGNVGAVGMGQMWGGGKDGGFGGGEGSHWTSFYDQRDSAYHHHRKQTDGRYMYGQGKEQQSRFEDYTFDGLALSDAFLSHYYSQKSSHEAKNQNVKDSLLVYDFEGQESHKESFEDICDLLHEGDDLSFLDDLDMRFKTLAEICSGTKIETKISTKVPVTSKPVLSATHKDVSAQSTVSHSQSQEKASSSTVIQTSAAQQTSSMSSAGVYVQEMVPNQTLLVQQPALYYTGTPVYVVEAQPTLMMPSNPVLGLQENLIVEEHKASGAPHRGTTKRETQHYQSVVLVEKQPTKESVQTNGVAQLANSEIMQSMEAQRVRQALHPSVQMINPEIMQSMEAQRVRQVVHPSVQMINTEILQSTESREVRREMHPSRRVMAGTVRETEVGRSALLDMVAPQSL
ncbi:hypothetical protein Q8A67_009554 [Cirrhinus molitorella]|uniref:Cadherin domain-containing protein n=1 Tax=Cirrhinus molitorella TaxID=172907 RepID=A0AA88Q1Y7_9TELE|nr:hypothetical protein Q8A67_009554 [Cirrhinus molitorella]